MWRSTPNRYSATMSAASSVATSARSRWIRVRRRCAASRLVPVSRISTAASGWVGRTNCGNGSRRPMAEQVAARGPRSRTRSRRWPPPVAPGGSAGASGRGRRSQPPALRVHLGPVELLLHPVEGVIADHAARAQVRQPSAAPPHTPAAARCRNRASRPPRPDRGRRRPARPGAAGPRTSAGGSRPSRARRWSAAASHPRPPARPARSRRARAAPPARPSRRRAGASELISGPTVIPWTTSVPSTTQKAVKRMKSRWGKAALPPSGSASAAASVTMPRMPHHPTTAAPARAHASRLPQRATVV